MSDPSLARLYRSRAAKHGEYAGEAELANVRKIHERAAAKWLDLAERIERGGIGRK